MTEWAWSIGRMILAAETEIFGGKELFIAPPGPPRTQHVLALGRNRASTNVELETIQSTWQYAGAALCSVWIESVVSNPLIWEFGGPYNVKNIQHVSFTVILLVTVGPTYGILTQYNSTSSIKSWNYSYIDLEQCISFRQFSFMLPWF
jgi:hypothetical protein